MGPAGARALPDAALVLYARVPRTGEVKTRMVPWLSPEEALRLHTALLVDSLGLVRDVAGASGVSAFVSFSEDWEPEDGPGCEDLAHAATGIVRLPQSGADLGARLQNTFRMLFSRRFGRVVVIGSDSPTLPRPNLRSALEVLLRDGEVVLGPADDGGYILVGATRLLPGMFENIPWGTGRVMAATLEALARADARVVVLPPWHDVDLPKDLERLRLDVAGSLPGDLVPERTRAFVEELVRAGRLPLSDVS